MAVMVIREQVQEALELEEAEELAGMAERLWRLERLRAD